MASKWWIRFLRKIGKRLLFPIGIHVGKRNARGGGKWCPTCSSVLKEN